MSYLSGMDSIMSGEQYINMREVEVRIDTLEGWVEDHALIERYRRGEAFSDLPWDEADAITEGELDELLSLRTLRDEVGELDAQLISEEAFRAYADETANDIYGIDGKGISEYFDYEKFADDYRQEFTEIDWEGTAYLYLS